MIILNFAFVFLSCIYLFLSVLFPFGFERTIRAQQSLCSEMGEELRFALRCQGSRQRPTLRRSCLRCTPPSHTYVPTNHDVPPLHGVRKLFSIKRVWNIKWVRERFGPPPPSFLLWKIGQSSVLRRNSSMALELFATTLLSIFAYMTWIVLLSMP